MPEYSKSELEEASKSIISTLQKCEKAFDKLRQGTPQWTLTDRRIKALRIACSLIERELREESQNAQETT